MLDRRGKDLPRLVEVAACVEHSLDPSLTELEPTVAWWDGNISSEGEARNENRDPGFHSVTDAVSPGLCIEEAK
jgi:hypothetical protein